MGVKVNDDGTKICLELINILLADQNKFHFLIEISDHSLSTKFSLIDKKKQKKEYIYKLYIELPFMSIGKPFQTSLTTVN